MLQRLPVGIQTFSEIIKGKYLYVDKTEAIYRLTQSSKYYFLSRPRRFGKSLTASTLYSLYRGEQQYFEGLWIYDKWDWTKQHPVIFLLFNNIDYKDQPLDLAIRKELDKSVARYGITLSADTLAERFKEAIELLYSSYGSVVILIDEYDKPLIDYLGKDEIQIAKANQQTLKGFYSVLKGADEYIELLFITGVSKFSRVSIFSDLNHLDDITLDKRFATLVGYTYEELEFYFKDWIEEVYAKHNHLSREEFTNYIKLWYDGYTWDGERYVYNPFSILNFCNKQSFEDYWFKTGTPTFLINLLKERQIYNFDNIVVNRNIFDSYDLENLETRSLLFQTGYLTIKNKDTRSNTYVLGYPNQEVAEAMYTHLLGAFGSFSSLDATVPIIQLRNAFNQNNLEKAIKIVHSLFKDIPYHLFQHQSELYFHALIHLIFNYLGIYTQSEVEVSDGRLDAVVQSETHVYIFEFKIDKSADIALTQIKTKDYAAKYITKGKKIIGVGINFSSKTKGIDESIWEEL